MLTFPHLRLLHFWKLPIPVILLIFCISCTSTKNSSVIPQETTKIDNPPYDSVRVLDLDRIRLSNELIIQRWTDPEKDSLDSIGFKLQKRCSACDSIELELWVSPNVELQSIPNFAENRQADADTLANFNYRVFFEPDPVVDPTSGDTIPIKAPIDPPITKVSVAVVDSGVDIAHVSLRNALGVKVLSELCYDSGPDGFGYDYINDYVINGSVYFAPEDEMGHGTPVNGAIVYNLPQINYVKILNLKFFGAERGTVFDAICGLYHAIAKKAHIINLSWGFISDEEFPIILYNALLEAKKAGILVITSAGNDTTDIDNINKYPAVLYEYPTNLQTKIPALKKDTLDNIITVTAYKVENNNIVLTDYANYGKDHVDIAAPGHLNSTKKGGGTERVDGTSIAAPLVARAAAIIMSQYPTLGYREVRNCLLDSSDPMTPSNVREIKYGSLNLEKALECAKLKASQ